uniref:Uncharacterized protein n=1 Tax=Malurus cyaneus samueli TaxID=2593467 RepID=A0A8C5TTU2_9PASS
MAAPRRLRQGGAALRARRGHPCTPGRPSTRQAESPRSRGEPRPPCGDRVTAPPPAGRCRPAAPEALGEAPTWRGGAGPAPGARGRTGTAGTGRDGRDGTGRTGRDGTGGEGKGWDGMEQLGRAVLTVRVFPPQAGAAAAAAAAGFRRARPRPEEPPAAAAEARPVSPSPAASLYPPSPTTAAGRPSPRRLPLSGIAQFTGSAFGSAAIWQYESLKSRVQTYFEEARTDWMDKMRPQKRGDFRKQVNSWWNNLTEGQRTVTGLC